MNTLTRRLNIYGIYCDSFKTEIKGTAGLRGYKILLGKTDLRVWVIANKIACYGFNSPRTVNELIDRYGNKKRRAK